MKIRKIPFKVETFKWGFLISILCEVHDNKSLTGFLYFHIDTIDYKRERMGLFIEGIIFNQSFYFKLLSKDIFELDKIHRKKAEKRKKSK